MKTTAIKRKAAPSVGSYSFEDAVLERPARLLPGRRDIPR
jgi:hypothetical protein